jgi:formate hydrogenlyase transcriptional activator
VLSVSPDELNLPIKVIGPATKTLEEVEREHIMQVLEFTNWVIGGLNGAAARLGLKRTTLHCRMEKLGIRRPNVPVNSII